MNFFIYNTVIIKKTQDELQEEIIKNAETSEKKDKRVHSTYVPTG